MNLESFQGPSPFLADIPFPFFDVGNTTSDQNLKSHIDYLKTEFYEYKIATTKTITELQQSVVTLTKQVQEMSKQLEELKKERSTASKGKSRRVKIPRELSVSDK